MHGAMGFVPLTYGEIAAWDGLQGRGIEDWEAQLLRHLSVMFCAARAPKAETKKPPEK